MTQALTQSAATAIGIPDRDYREVVQRLGREPNTVEARMFAVMWSEHCGYKHSRRTLRRLARTSPRVLSGEGSNAGVVSIGDGWAVAFKMESHNHPSAVDPYNGAATGVGGIIRDVLAMGARPIALLDSLRFGPLDDARSRRLAGGVVAGIAGYGNAIGVPTVGGELLTDPCYRDNPLVNVACLGLVRADRVMSAAAHGPGDDVLYVGARTGRDGIGGAAFASVELDESREQADRASVQIGDPFTGKSLIEATLEALEARAVVAMQDMGAGGITCATSEMAARGQAGMTIDLDQVPLREPGMRAEEILLSESQERMLLVVRPEDSARVAAVYHRWGLAAEVIGHVTSDRRLRVTWQGRTVADLPPDALADAPIYDPEAQEPDRRVERGASGPSGVLHDPAAVLLRLLAHPDVASKRAIFEQYDHMVGVRTVHAPGTDAAVLRILDIPPAGLALVADGNARWCADNPRAGATRIVLEAAANLACVGAEPVAVTDCLNFGSPEHPDVFWTFREAVDGTADACTALDVPVTGGNVSFYNEAAGNGDAAHDGAAVPDGRPRAMPRGILPTPVIGMVGVVDDIARCPGPGFVREGDLVVLLGAGDVSLRASLYSVAIEGPAAGRIPDPDLSACARVIGCVRQASRDGLLASAHDVSDGGTAVALAEACIHGQVGAEVTLTEAPVPDTRTDDQAVIATAETWFGEGSGRFVVSVEPNRLGPLEALAKTRGAACKVIGAVGGTSLRIRSPKSTDIAPPAVEVSVRALTDAWNSLEV
ncbi:MAG TPA: phosphoribosylformylglycinamidine synthase subunit PurL [bacterium]|nr:phosphoribosylformylglycinamidine synthase subunit PurL [bacterium]